MSPVTMTFGVKDPAMLNKVKEGDKVKSQVENVDGEPKVVELTKQGK